MISCMHVQEIRSFDAFSILEKRRLTRAEQSENVREKKIRERKWNGKVNIEGEGEDKARSAILTLKSMQPIIQVTSIVCALQ